MGLSTRDNGMLIPMREMEEGYKCGWMEAPTKAIGRKIKLTAKGD